MRSLFDMFPVDADEFYVEVVRNDGCTWEHYGTYATRLDAMDAVGSMDKSKYRLIGIQPQRREMCPFQTHPLYHVYEA